MSTRYAACALLCLACAAPAAQAAASPPTFRVQLQDPIPQGDRDYQLTDMNNAGELVGYSYAVGSVYSYAWRDGRVTQLKDMKYVGSSGSDHHNVYALGINNAGTIVGHAYETGEGLRGGIVWSSQDAEPTPLPQPGMFGRASALNDKDTVAGTFYDAPGTSSDAAVLWRAAGVTTMWRADAGDPDGRLASGLSGYDTDVTDLNAHDQAIGWVEAPHVEDIYRPGHWSKRPQAIYWDGGTARVLQSTEADWEFTQATAINDEAMIVGFASQYGPNEESPSAYRAVSWVDGVMSFLDGTESADTSYALDINEQGWIVGGIGGDAVLWLDGEALRLDTLLAGTTGALGAFDLTGAGFVNDRGQILVSGRLDGIARFAVLTPVPEPGTVALSLGGLGVLAWRMRGRGSARMAT